MKWKVCGERNPGLQRLLFLQCLFLFKLEDHENFKIVRQCHCGLSPRAPYFFHVVLRAIPTDLPIVPMTRGLISVREIIGLPAPDPVQSAQNSRRADAIEKLKAEDVQQYLEDQHVALSENDKEKISTITAMVKEEYHKQKASGQTEPATKDIVRECHIRNCRKKE